MLQITPQMRVLVAVEPIDGRKGIDSLAQICRQQLAEDPFSGCVFIFRTRSRTSIRVLCYDGSGFWLAQKRLSKGSFRWWPDGTQASCTLEAHQIQVLLAAGDPSVRGAPVWRKLRHQSLEQAK
jgi:transposase